MQFSSCTRTIYIYSSLPFSQVPVTHTQPSRHGVTTRGGKRVKPIRHQIEFTPGPSQRRGGMDRVLAPTGVCLQLGWWVNKRWKLFSDILYRLPCNLYSHKRTWNLAQNVSIFTMTASRSVSKSCTGQHSILSPLPPSLTPPLSFPSPLTSGKKLYYLQLNV